MRTKLSLSNLAWDPALSPAVFECLSKNNFSAIEVAPTRIAPWDELTVDRLRTYRSQAANAGLVISSLQAILFGRPDHQLLGTNVAFSGLTDHFKRVADIASILGARVLVFGAPQNRKRGQLEELAAEELAVERLRAIGDIIQPYGLIVGIEPVPPYYGGEFLKYAHEVRRIVRTARHAAIGVHLDTACVLLGGGGICNEILAAEGQLVHFHIAEPDLRNLECGSCPHESAALSLRETSYSGWMVVEMRQSTGGIDDILAAVKFANRVYR